MLSILSWSVRWCFYHIANILLKIVQWKLFIVCANLIVFWGLSSVKNEFLKIYLMFGFESLKLSIVHLITDMWSKCKEPENVIVHSIQSEMSCPKLVSSIILREVQEVPLNFYSIPHIKEKLKLDNELSILCVQMPIPKVFGLIF